ncbi:hypothetical protein M422DRAFT_30676 [Sphaerobolus stellatus SS14]|uniref:Zn(2)-C6 fungal-type domain-containing protein n=1 Tax=Sphaerobolus stellatus (strain SS14) TaxID=990650 RepID=A0A0C9VB19_SPHS4|nr:hypothetical protein M422DRAFT_30676 [Sphaerobolus stellatus SS14]
MTSLSPSEEQSKFGEGSRSQGGACRECRRSKIGCSRTVPCDACIHRGCADVCPDGIKEKRRSKNDETLIHQNARLVRRIHYLESILASMNHPEGLNPSLDAPGDSSSASSSTSFPALEDDTPPRGQYASFSQRDLAGLERTIQDYTRNRASLRPGVQFILRAVSDLFFSLDGRPSSSGSNVTPGPDLGTDIFRAGTSSNTVQHQVGHEVPSYSTAFLGGGWTAADSSSQQLWNTMQIIHDVPEEDPQRHSQHSHHQHYPGSQSNPGPF